MAITWHTDIPLASVSTFRVGGKASRMAVIETENDLLDLFAGLSPQTKWFVIGGGSNVVFPDGDSDILLIHFAPQPVRFEPLNADEARMIAPAGAIWDTVVSLAVDQGLSGIEALSAIPGSVGATPIQNVGAYGREVSDIIESVRAFDTHTKEFIIFSNKDCQFDYRDSIFKHEAKGRYIITEVAYILSHDAPDVPRYPGVAEYLAEHQITRASLADIRNAIVAIRANKLPDPREIASVGSFFKNPFVPVGQAQALKEQYPGLAVFPLNDTLAKVGAGSLIDAAGFKGKRFGTISVYKNNALVLVNEGGATRKELHDVVEMIVEEVKNKFGISIEPEPELLEF